MYLAVRILQRPEITNDQDQIGSNTSGLRNGNNLANPMPINANEGSNDVANQNVQSNIRLSNVENGDNVRSLGGAVIPPAVGVKNPPIGGAAIPPIGGNV